MKSLVVWLTCLLSAFVYSCVFATVNNQYEKAGTLKKGNLELSGNYTRYSASGGGGTESTNNTMGFRGSEIMRKRVVWIRAF
jgi:hypothetical protein